MLDISTLKPLPPFVLVRRLEPESKFSPDSMLILPDNQVYKNRRCEVIAVHKGRRFGHRVEPCSVEVGQLVEVIIFDGDPIGKHEQSNYEFVREENIIAALVPTCECDQTVAENCIVCDEDPNDSLGG